MTPEETHRTRGWTDPETFHARMRDDPRFATEIAFCADHGIPHSVFLGRPWPNPTRPLEPQWQEADRDKAVAYQQWTGQLCPGCGLHPLDWPSERDETHRGVLVTCFGCVEQGDTIAQIPKDIGDVRRQSLRVHLERRDPDEFLLLEAREQDLIDD